MSSFFRFSFIRQILSSCICLFLLFHPVTATGENKGAVQDSSSQIKVAQFQTVHAFLAKYCVSCHGPDDQNGDRRFDTLSGVIDSDNTLVDFQDILDQLNLGEMPPADELQPSIKERRLIIEALTKSIREYHVSRQGEQVTPVLRRLNSREYKNTIRDLFQLNTTIFDPTINFPLDQKVEHLDNVGEKLVVSGHLLDRYLDAAEQVVDKALFPLQKPKVQTWKFKDGFRQQPEIDQVFRKTNKFAWMTLFDVRGADKHEGAYGPIHAFAEGVPYDGYYEIRLKAEAVNRLHPYDPEFLGTDPSEPLRLGIVPGNQDVGPLHKPQPIEPILAEIELADEQKWYTVRVWLDAGYTPRFTFENGLMDVRNLYSRLIRKYPELFPKLKSRGIVETRFNAIHHGKMPQIRIHEIEIKGPINETWPKPSQRAIFGEQWNDKIAQGKLSRDQISELFERLLPRAYRRPLQPGELDRVLKVVDQQITVGRSNMEAFRDGLLVILSSPGFLYLQQANQSANEQYAIASRLSYFLWSSMPDEELLELAAAGKLSDPVTMTEQVERMLNDARSQGFVNDFLDSWLTLRDLGSTPPDRSQFREYYHYDLYSAMRQETALFTRELLEKNLSVEHFLNADFTFVNRPLARFYGVDLPRGTKFEKMSFDNPLRGGLLGQASVLTVTANGIDTSPVVRGVWVLENILGTPPSPPPPDVEPLDPDIRGAKTIRDQLQKHRSVASCNDCHRKIDPLGFALESFNPIGKIRNVYPNKAKIETAGKLLTGQEFQNIAELKQILLQRKELFVKALAEKMLSYSIGRQIVPADRAAIDLIVQSIAEQGHGFRDLIHSVVLSEPFLGAVNP